MTIILGLIVCISHDKYVYFPILTQKLAQFLCLTKISVIMNSNIEKPLNADYAIKAFSDATKLLKAKSDVLESILASMGDGLSIQDLDLRIIYQNNFIIENFGSHVGEYCYRIYEQRDEPCEGCPIIEAFETGKTSKALRRGVKKNGDKFRFENIATILHGDDGKIIAGVEVVRLVEDRERALEKLAESLEALEQLRSKLSQSNSMKDLLLDIITHDVRNPAGAIIGAVELLKEDQMDEELLMMIQKSSENLLKIITHATSLSKVAMDEELETEKLNLYDLVKEVIEGFSSSLKSYDMFIENNIPYGYIIKANPIIEEVLSNYISNAIKYASSGKKIIIDCREYGEYLDIYVKDLGETIPVDKREAVFVRNLQLAVSKGRGLGLSIAKKIAEAHHGSVWVEPNSPRGNSFALRIPAK